MAPATRSHDTEPDADLDYESDDADGDCTPCEPESGRLAATPARGRLRALLRLRSPFLGKPHGPHRPEGRVCSSSEECVRTR
jgi:hypothetical protein